MAKNENQGLIPNERIINKIYMLRGEKVMFDTDLAELYQVETKALNRAVKRNTERFPKDFMFQLTEKEAKILRYQFGTLGDENLRCQNGTSSYGGRRYAPYVFTEQGVAMLSAVLKSKRAVAVSIQIVRTFVKLREILSTHKQLKEKVELMENKYDKSFKVVFQMIARLMKEDTEPKKKIGFYAE